MKDFRNAIPFIIISVAVIVGITAIYGVVVSKINGDTAGWSSSGTFGDSFGALTAVFTGLAFAGVIYTIILQKQELAAQREELKLTRDEFKQQNETLSLQRFENTFFQLIQVHSENVKGLKFEYSSGREFFSYFYRNEIATKVNTKKEEYYRAIYNERPGPHDLQAMQLTIADLIAQYESLFLKYEYMLSHYFRHLYRIVHIIDESSVKDKGRYIGILRAQLSTYEILVLFYNGLSKYGVKNFKPLIEDYGVLSNVNESELFNKGQEKENYKPSAFR